MPWTYTVLYQKSYHGNRWIYLDFDEEDNVELLVIDCELMEWVLTFLVYTVYVKIQSDPLLDTFLNFECTDTLGNTIMEYLEKQNKTKQNSRHSKIKKDKDV